MSLVANLVEASGIPTLLVGTVRDIVERVKPPRAVCIDNPVGRTFGPPRASRKQESLLAETLGRAHAFTRKGQIIDLPGNWTDRPGASWQDMVRREILRLPRR
ncbi:MAG: hypothetical protein OXE53_14360 [Deltaproteobacteria bacterium]|nr:hypothetical protein [Deltaproteobacteria bacterium]